MGARLERRHFLAGLGAGLGVAGFGPAWAGERLLPTPRQTEGPFYPDRLPLDTDNDLTFINDRDLVAEGEIAYLGGRVLDLDGRPLRNATVEIWQVDGHGVYLHSGSGSPERRDPNFQGFGRFTTGSTGEYLFRTVKPVPYPGRTPHIHMAVKLHGRKELVTQCYIRDHPGNAGDEIWRSLGDAARRRAVTVPFEASTGPGLREYSARLDLILGRTPEAPEGKARPGALGR